MKAKTMAGKHVAIMSCGKASWWAVLHGEEWTLVHATMVISSPFPASHNGGIMMPI